MANVNGNFSYSLVDEVGIKAPLTLPMRFSDAVTLAQLQTAWGAMAALVDALSAGQIQRGSISFQELGTGKGAPVADGRVSEVGVFDFGITGSSNKQGIAVPALRDSLAPLGKIDLTAGAVSDWTTAIAAAITGGGVYATPEGVALTALIDAFSSVRKHRRQERSLTFEL